MFIYRYKAATSSSEEARAVVLRFVQAVVRGDLPHPPRLLDARLLPLAKPNGHGVRPIAIGEVWYRLAALCALATCPTSAAASPRYSSQWASRVAARSSVTH
jgi:hypothetical protein